MRLVAALAIASSAPLPHFRLGSPTYTASVSIWQIQVEIGIVPLWGPQLFSGKGGECSLRQQLLVADVAPTRSCSGHFAPMGAWQFRIRLIDVHTRSDCMHAF